MSIYSCVVYLCNSGPNPTGSLFGITKTVIIGMVITQLHENVVVALKKRSALDNHGSYNNETSQAYIPCLYKHNCTVGNVQRQLQH